MNLKDIEEHHRSFGSKFSVGSSSASYVNIKVPTQIAMLDARTQQVLIGQLSSVTNCVRQARTGVAVARSFKIPDLEKHSCGSWGVSLLLPGADLIVFQMRELIYYGMRKSCSPCVCPTKPSLYRSWWLVP